MRKKYVPPRTETIMLQNASNTLTTVSFKEGSSITDGSDIEVGAKDNTSFGHNCWADDEDDQQDHNHPHPFN